MNKDKEEFKSYIENLAFEYNYKITEEEKEKWWSEFKDCNLNIFFEACEEYKKSNSVFFPKPIQIVDIIIDIRSEKKQKEINQEIQELQDATEERKIYQRCSNNCHPPGLILSWVRWGNSEYLTAGRCTCEASKNWSSEIPISRSIKDA